ncbi:hypothetical protein NSPZN2_10407 [Nitrospira defluvii]|uniref:Uncharacterized protein n=1 Tax=Nitrospira defluvii TaxID=330214 RepID=A0ABN7KIA3_9BACT|nr:hypothetical protein NSPZN2_10407 [Nitrospira defluvii]
MSDSFLASPTSQETLCSERPLRHGLAANFEADSSSTAPPLCQQMDGVKRMEKRWKKRAKLITQDGQNGKPLEQESPCDS